MNAPVTWLPARVPSRLRERVDALAGGAQDPASLLDAATRAARHVLRAEASDRGAALDLLAVDALVTHAMDRLADDPATFEVRCADALRALAAIPDVP